MEPFASLRDRFRCLELLNELGDLMLARLNPDGYHEQARTNVIAPTEGAPIGAHPAFAAEFMPAVIVRLFV